MREQGYWFYGEVEKPEIYGKLKEHERRYSEGRETIPFVLKEGSIVCLTE